MTPTNSVELTPRTKEAIETVVNALLRGGETLVMTQISGRMTIAIGPSHRAVVQTLFADVDQALFQSDGPLCEAVLKHEAGKYVLIFIDNVPAWQQ